MNINYFGADKLQTNNTCRVACIEYDDSENQLADRLLFLMKVTNHEYYDRVSLFENAIFIGVDDKNDYKAFVDWYKQAKKSIKMWYKFGF